MAPWLVCPLRVDFPVMTHGCSSLRTGAEMKRRSMVLSGLVLPSLASAGSVAADGSGIAAGQCDDGVATRKAAIAAVQGHAAAVMADRYAATHGTSLALHRPPVAPALHRSADTGFISHGFRDVKAPETVPVAAPRVEMLIGLFHGARPCGSGWSRFPDGIEAVRIVGVAGGQAQCASCRNGRPMRGPVPVPAR